MASAALERARTGLRMGASMTRKIASVSGIYRGRGRTDPAPPIGQMCSALPYADSTLSCIISDSVGCGNTVCISSASVVSSCLPTV